MAVVDLIRGRSSEKMAPHHIFCPNARPRSSLSAGLMPATMLEVIDVHLSYVRT